MRKIRVEHQSIGTKLVPTLNYDNGEIVVYIGFWSDGSPYVQVETSPDSDLWMDLDVFMNDGKAVRWE